jgi:hypothetical protein
MYCSEPRWPIFLSIPTFPYAHSYSFLSVPFSLHACMSIDHPMHQPDQPQEQTSRASSFSSFVNAILSSIQSSLPSSKADGGGGRQCYTYSFAVSSNVEATHSLSDKQANFSNLSLEGFGGGGVRYHVAASPPPPPPSSYLGFTIAELDSRRRRRRRSPRKDSKRSCLTA